MFGLRMGAMGTVGSLRTLAQQVASIFARNSTAPEVWYDPSDLTTLYQDSAGTTPVTAIEQPVGLMLDKSKGLVLGSELVSNGDFSGGLTGWTNSSTGTGTATVVAGVATLTGTDGSNRGAVSQQLTGLTVGRTYVVSWMSTGVNGAFTVQTTSVPGTGAVYIGTTATNRFVFNATATTMWPVWYTPIAGGTLTVDNISVRELPGNHASQATSTSRPVLSARKNLLVNTETLATQNVTVRALGHILSFWGTGTVTLSGVSTAGPLVGTGADNRVSLAFTPTAGTLTLTVTGSVTRAQLELVNEAP